MAGTRYPIHPAANLGPIDEKVVEDLVTRMKTFGFSEAEPLELIDGQIVDGRHRQEAALRAGVTPPVVSIELPEGQDAHEYVLNKHHLRPISTKQRMVYVVDAFPTAGPAKIARRLGRNYARGGVSDIRAAIKACREWPEDWGRYKAGEINQTELGKIVGVAPGGKSSLGAKVQKLETEVAQERDDRALLEADIKDLEQQLRRSQKEAIATEKLARLFEEKIDAKVPRYKPAPKQGGGELTTHHFFMEWSDLHAAEVVNEQEMNGLNAYDWGVMLRRHEAMRQAVLSFREHRPYPVDKLYIGALGDMVTGDIHDELRETNEMVLAEATTQLALDMAEWIEGFVPEFNEIRITGVVGNHGRMSKKPTAKQAYNNFDWLFYQMLSQRLAKYESIRVDVPKAAMTPITIFDKRILLWHGDGVRSTMVGVPWGGYMRRIKELDATYSAMGLPIDHYAVGHMHEPNVIQGGKILMNGSIKGPDEYSLRAFGGGAPASQNLFTFHPRRGLTDWSRLELQGVS